MAIYKDTPNNNGKLTGGLFSDTLYGYEGNDTLLGGGSNDTLYGGDGDDSLDGGSGSDLMDGGNGNDYYKIDATGDKIVEGNTSLSGIDTVETTITLDLSRVDLVNVEYATLVAGTAVLNLTGNGLANQLKGNDGANTLTGGGGADTLFGNGGNDVLYGDADNDKLSGGLGLDTLNGGAGNDTLLGDDGNDRLNGDAGDDYLDGGVGADVMWGADGNDTFIIDNAGDSIIESGTAASGFADTVISSIALNLTTRTDLANIENASLATTGASVTLALNLTGNGLANVLTGNLGVNVLDGGANNDQLYGLAGNDSLLGGAGDDTLDGGEGADALNGGTGNDTYVVDNVLDTITDADAATTTDTLFYRVEGALALTGQYALIDSAALQSTGNHKLTGNALNNVLHGNDGNNIILGDAGNDVIFGYAGNDSIDGGSGDDIMAGGIGNDIYIVDSLLDQVNESADIANGDSDTVRTQLSYSLEGLLGIENLTLTGTDNSTGTGNALGNSFLGNSGDNAIYGLGGDDIINGGKGADTLFGGDGDDYLYNPNDDVADVFDGGAGADTMWDTGFSDDTYYVDNADDIVDDRGGAADLIILTTGNTLSYDLSNQAYSSNLNEGVENVQVQGTGTMTVTGNALDNWFVGNDARNAFSGGAGDDNLDGQGGDDILNGEDGNDLLLGGDGVDLISGGAGNDVLDGGAGADSMFGNDGDDTYYLDSVDDNITESAGLNSGTDTVNVDFADVDLRNFGNIENLNLLANGLNATGNDLDNVIQGNEGDNTLNAMGGNDVVIGGGGIDQIDGGEGNDTLIGGDGDDVLNGGNGNDVIEAEAGDDTLFGGLGADTLSGGDGFDTYYTSSSSDVVIETINGGFDTLFATNDVLSAEYVEHIELLGTGNFSITASDESEELYGNAGNNHIIAGGGDDYIVGRDGADTLEGGAGDDLYDEVDSLDTFVEAANGGLDTVHTSALSVRLSDNIEVLQYFGAGNFHGWAGNTGTRMFSSSGNDTLEGGDGNDLLDGSSGDDLMIGGGGNDVYYMRQAGDRIQEAANGGRDRINMYVQDIVMAEDSNVEAIRSSNSAGLRFTGNNKGMGIYGSFGGDTFRDGTGTDYVVGGVGNDTIYMGLGNDFYGTYNALDGFSASTNDHLGNDSYYYAASTAGAGQDRILDNDATTGNADSLFMTGVNANSLWLSQNQQDLVISVLGTDRQVSVTNWFSASSYHLETIVATGNQLKLDHNKVDALVSAMATLSPSGAVPTSLTTAQQTTLTNLVASNWTAA